MLSSAYSISKLLGSLTVSWITLGWKVRKARKAFEAELTKEGMRREDAERISKCYSDLRDQFSVRNIMSYLREADYQENP